MHLVYTSMERPIKIFVFVMFIPMIMAQAKDICQNLYPGCEAVKSSCDKEIFKRLCPHTCRSCPTGACSITNGGCDHKCNVIGDDVVCSCFDGFKLEADGKTCKDIDECVEGANPCSMGFQGYCVNSVGSYSCERYQCRENGTMNYYRSEKCCQLEKNSYGITASIKKHIDGENKQIPSIRGRIFGGFDSAATTWPWMAQIMINELYPHCGATLISGQWMISAAHCFRRYSYRRMIVHLGRNTNAKFSNFYESNTIQRRIATVIIHEEFSSNFANDIALVKLDQSVPFSDFVSPISLPCGEVPEEGKKCWATGFGQTEFRSSASAEFLQEVDLPIISTEVCANVFRKDEKIDPNKMMCAGYKEGKKDACRGDSGGPLVCQRKDSCQWYLSGITSFGKSCALVGYYGVYANVLNYEDWIRQKLGKDADGLCPKTYNPCRNLANVDKDCYSKLDRCTKFPFYMQAKCKLACCQLKNKKVSSCIDNSKYAAACKMYAKECSNPAFHSFMSRNCKKSCNFC